MVKHRGAWTPQVSNVALEALALEMERSSFTMGPRVPPGNVSECSGRSCLKQLMSGIKPQGHTGRCSDAGSSMASKM